MRRCLALLVLVPAVGCGDIKTIAEDGGPGEDAEPEVADAGNTSDPLNGTWTWWIGDNPDIPDSTCEVTIGGGTYEVYCASDPFEVAPDCMRTKNDTRIQGSWTEAFAGTFDEIERYEGTGCVPPNTPVDVDIVTEGILLMEADHAQASQATGFLQLAYGDWDFSLWAADDQANAFPCAVNFAPGDADGVSFRVDCVDPDSDEPVANCTHTSATVIEGTLDATTMAGEGWSEDRYDGSGCAPTYPDPVVEDPAGHTPMGADKH